MDLPTSLVVPFLLTLAPASQAAAQITVFERPEPAVAEQHQGPTGSLEDAVALLRDENWFAGYRALVELAEGRRQAVLEAVAPLARQDGDPRLAGRARVVIDAIATAHGAAGKRDELRDRLARLVDAQQDLERAIARSAPDAAAAGRLDAALAAVAAATAALEKAIASPQPLHPTPLRVPAGSGGATAPAPGGYRQIEVDGRIVLVPEDAVPDGTHVDAEWTEQGLVVRRYRDKAKGAGKGDGKADGSGTQGPGGPAGGQPTGGTPDDRKKDGKGQR